MGAFSQKNKKSDSPTCAVLETNFHGCTRTRRLCARTPRDRADRRPASSVKCAVNSLTCTCTSAKGRKKNIYIYLYIWGIEGGGDEVNEGKGRASSQRERERERESGTDREKTQLTLFQATPLSNSSGSACIPLASRQPASQSHTCTRSQSEVSL